MSQEEFDDICDGLDIRYDVLDNLSGGRCYYKASITFTNNSSTTLTYAQRWSLYFSHIHSLEPDFPIDDEDFIYIKQGVRLQQFDGDIHCLSPTADFDDLEPGMTLTLPITSESCSVSRNDHFPNWYLCFGGDLKPQVVKSTVGEGLKYVGAFDSPKKWKRYDYKKANGERVFDAYDPPTPHSVYKSNRARSSCKSAPSWTVLPTPESVVLDESKTVSFDRSEWSVRCDNSDWVAEARLISDYLNVRLTTEPTSANSIVIKRADSTCGAPSPESYRLTIRADDERITIEASTRSGVLYAGQTLRSLCAARSATLPDVEVRDSPRFSYRGMHLDVSRNFHAKEEVLRLIDAMAMYKLNRLHLHLSDDEGWRIEIPGLEELTSVSSKRGHDPTERTCLMPYLGSGPTIEGSSGTGYYTTQDYREILRYATQRCIEVIPEIDLPGHAHAAINAMQVRYERLMASNDKTEAERYLLLNRAHVNTGLAVASVQNFHSNAVDPTLESTYQFLEKVVTTFLELHADIAPLETFHLGGDEVPFSAWGTYRSCQRLLDEKKIDSFVDLMETFVSRASEILARHDLRLGIWQDGLLVSSKHGTIAREKVAAADCWAYAWRNNYESSRGDCAYGLANGDYKVIQCEGSHLYFDHPQSPDPEDPGLYWAARYIDTFKVFSFMPDDLIGCHDIDQSGAEFTADDQREAREMWSKLEKPHNVIGIQGHLWSELVRTPSQLHLMIFPRLLALAERAWHKAPWEREPDDDAKLDDWSNFASSLGTKELNRLDEMSIRYHIPIPGAIIENNELKMNSCYPGLPLQYSMDSGQSWLEYVRPVRVDTGCHVLVRSCSADRRRRSRETTLCMNQIKNDSSNYLCCLRNSRIK